MTTKAKATTTAKPKFTPSAVTSAVQKQLTLATEIGTLGANGVNINQQMDEKCQAIRKMRKGNPVGTIKNGCAVVIAFRDAQVSLKLAPQTIANNVAFFRKAINEGKKYDVNANRAKKKGAKTSTKKDDAKTSGVTFKGDATIQDISKGLRVMFNKFKENDKTLALAGFLIDALDEFDEQAK